ncbi:MAG: hypothetical protein KIS68_10125 [Bauldia sp.]|nr:hypothetical protein [Bauldia sp.]
MAHTTALGAARVDEWIVSAGNTLGLARARVWDAIKLRRRLAHPIVLGERKRLARQLEGGPLSTFIPPATACRLFDETALPGAAAAVRDARAILAAWDADPVANALWGKVEAGEKRPHTFNIMADEDLDRHPDIVAFALSRPVTEAITGYFGHVPRLRQMGVHITQAEEGGPSLRNAQRLHRDAPDQRSRKLRIFLNLDDVGPETGPFSFLPLDLSTAALAATGDEEPTDRSIADRFGSDAFLSLTGPAGSGVVIDTSRCLHYGGRVSAGRRAVLMLHYTAVPDARVGKPAFEHPRHGRYDLRRFLTDDPYRRLLLNQHG